MPRACMRSSAASSIAEHTLVAFGGAAPLHACRLAEKLGIDRIVIPADAGVGSAIGFLKAPAAFEMVRSRFMRLDDLRSAAANRLLDAMSREARTLAEAAAAGRELIEERSRLHALHRPGPRDRRASCRTGA